MTSGEPVTRLRDGETAAVPPSDLYVVCTICHHKGYEHKRLGGANSLCSTICSACVAELNRTARDTTAAWHEFEGRVA